ncbi:Cof-type HAD-IIB family hydrolase [Sporosarcina jiandibaonis]|uniref:Cof-type HAD-IIB family hydrolase n=1 Tax=Sporosarcina jiandibaonis TaxID=2715535 RepID=UPI0015566E28|nr:Cof-type HAD-IIB family hydrolase [Sporosarcina jiandibaonis]
MVRLIAIDMDGTILSPDQTISTKNKETILEAQSNGIEVVIATGRSYAEALFPISDAGLTVPFILLNGAEVRNEDGDLLSATYLTESDVKKVIPILEKESIDYQLFVGKTVYTKSIEDQIDTFIQLAVAANQVPPVDEIREEVMNRVEKGFVQEVPSLRQIVNQHGEEIYKIFGTSFNKVHLDNAREKLKLLPGLAVSSSGAGNLEITNINAQKGIALEQYAKMKGISMDEVMAIGDNYNDLSMLKIAGHSVAMGNAPAEIQEACKTVTTTNEFDGVATAIESALRLKI